MWSSVRALLFLRNVEFNQNQRRRMDVFLKQENLPGWGRNVDWELLVWPLELALIRSSYKLVHVYTFWRFPLFYGWIRVTIDTLFFESTRNNKSERPRTVIICLFRHLGVISAVPQRASLNLSLPPKDFRLYCERERHTATTCCDIISILDVQVFLVVTW